MRARREALHAIVASIDELTDQIIAYEAGAGACSLSAVAKTQLACARLSVSHLITIVQNNAELSPPAKALLSVLKQKELDYATVDESAYEELRQRDLACVVFSATGNRVFATAAGKAVR